MAEAAEAERRLRAEVQASKVAKAGSESATPTPANEEQTLAPAPAAKEESVIAQMVTEDQTMNDGSAQQVKQESVEPSAETQPAGTNGSVAKDKEVKSEEAQPTPSTDADAHTSVRDQPATKAAEKNAEIAAKVSNLLSRVRFDGKLTIACIHFRRSRSGMLD